MKTELTQQQSAHLIELGVCADKASATCLDFNGTCAYVSGEEEKTVRDCVNSQFYVEESKVFTIADVIAMLPKGIIYEGLSCKLRITSWYDEPWFAAYQNQVGEYITPLPYKAPFSAEEFIDVLYELLCWVIENYSVDYLNANQQ